MLLERRQEKVQAAGIVVALEDRKKGALIMEPQS